jgi:uncharacterized protein YndB with AHSA1/START domain
MSGRAVEHATFVVERKYEAPPERTFAAWADPEVKACWYSDAESHLDLDFRVGGRERSRGTAPDGRAYRYEAVFYDIVPAQRIVYTYEMFLEGTRISVSLATVEFTPEGDGGTNMVFTEQGAYLDGGEPGPARRRHGQSPGRPGTGAPERYARSLSATHRLIGSRDVLAGRWAAHPA